MSSYLFGIYNGEGSEEGVERDCSTFGTESIVRSESCPGYSNYVYATRDISRDINHSIHYSLFETDHRYIDQLNKNYIYIYGFFHGAVTNKCVCCHTCFKHNDKDVNNWQDYCTLHEQLYTWPTFYDLFSHELYNVNYKRSALFCYYCDNLVYNICSDQVTFPIHLQQILFSL